MKVLQQKITEELKPVLKANKTGFKNQQL